MFVEITDDRPERPLDVLVFVPGGRERNEGDFRSQSNKDFPANTFQQYSLAGFGDTTPVPNEQIFFFVLNGDAMICLSTTDNRTNDSSARFARRE